MRNSTSYLFVLASVLLVSFAQLILKFGMLSLPGEPSLETYFKLITIEYFTAALLPILVGLICYLISMVAWMKALTALPLSLAYPLLSVSYILVYLGAVYFPSLHETTSPHRLLGIILIVVGVVFVASPNIKNKQPLG